ncbi:BMP family ABC transporter substrate-binding protein [Desertifilum sp. FACHB-1129]|uniref:BMP family ABC transporter substrate-binding protein n=1 Tax=Desertifilum tharense IPPAS B-1220 TaxID=1781255 RepID=A0A1E5QLX9_9CYAN|nr:MULTISPECIES: BMP family ABC transporter substrate-binding protein [Desertifilum]MDA0213022.1 BMP family ABC transporter substrate-binding protein [Cyanobacteria bacterium FC1]MDI9639294.1 BMP family ABC transporter substrate-binding protein [Geitlerinema splendidum]MBD2313656.1 BMP family ABC transporter substrate-binding protein [Desertifilum sp. FACHB-1129]MBD2324830.1 BMP family ABC transporter substrate-binding protein [Desertifilum sp. FACHB-866]MBD2334922.1 BMP family ABC transporter
MKFSSIKPFSIALSVSVLLAGCNGTNSQSGQGDADNFQVGLILVGPRNDAGWSQAHYEGIEYVQQQISGVTLEYADKVNPGDRPNVKGSQVADDLIAKGADLIIFNSDDLKDDALETAQKYPNIPVIHASGDSAWQEGQNYQALPNLANVMPKMEYGRMIAGCAAALSSETGRIGFLGPLINDETRRLVSAAYLGARYCWQTYRDRNPEDLNFRVTWIGFWFNIPGVTLEPTKVADDFYNSGYDVVMTGIDTPEAAVQAKKAADSGKNVKFLHYTLRSGCNLAPDVCVGVPTYNWGPSYLKLIQDAQAGNFQSQFIWADPDWQDINNPDTSAVGFVRGEAFSPENNRYLDQFIQGLGDGSINLYQGPLNYQDGTPFVAAGQTATLQQIWYMPQLLEGIEGPSR